jgi:hypothetical protein
MYAVYDTFNNKIVSRHRMIEAAVKADCKFQRRIKKVHGQSSYVPTRISKIGRGCLVDLSKDDYAWMIECYNRIAH